MLTVLMNIRSTKVLWLVEDDLQWKTTFDIRPEKHYPLRD